MFEAKKTREINFYSRYLYDPEKVAQRRLITLVLIPAVVVLLIIIGVFSYLKINDFLKLREMNDIKDYLNSPTVLREYSEAQELITKKNQLISDYDAMNDVKNTISGLPPVDAGLLGNVNGCMGGAAVEGYRYDSANGALVVSVTSKAATGIPPIVKRLKSTGQFADVTYTGYEDEKGDYHAAISCIID